MSALESTPGKTSVTLVYAWPREGRDVRERSPAVSDERVKRLAEQLYTEGYAATEAEARLAAEEVLAAANAMSDPADGGAAKPRVAMQPEPEEPTPT